MIIRELTVTILVGWIHLLPASKNPFILALFLSISLSNYNTQSVSDFDSDSNSETLIPRLPNEIAELCLVHLPYPYHALARSVSSSWNRAITVGSSKPVESMPWLGVPAKTNSPQEDVNSAKSDVFDSDSPTG
ncbi:F-box protein AFR [Senna tora]|uniref:F-box protein AFR n=1 Tax=Senna tora TaxID=362788 RepID=A0A834X935_9FABA|nr:F-box protein AFR [Senna tora]